MKDFPALAKARAAAEALARRLASEQAERAGAGAVEVNLEAKETSAELDGGKTLFVELAVTATAFGRPRVAAE